jgi:hypothetical protein
MMKSIFRMAVALICLFCFTTSCDTGSPTTVSLKETPGFPFAQTATVRTGNVDNIDSVSFTVHTKPGNTSKDVNVTYMLGYLKHSGYVHADYQTIDVPVFGLYADYLNVVDIIVTRKDGSSTTTTLNAQTSAFTSTYALSGITINKKYENPSLSFLLIESNPASPIIMDIDGEVRWQAEVADKVLQPVYFDSSGFLAGDTSGRSLLRIDFNGQVKETHELSDESYSAMKHNIEPGKQGMLVSVAFKNGDAYKPESYLIEMKPTGEIVNAWDFDGIVGSQIAGKGEIPTQLVQNGADWFHINSSVYSGYDDSIIVSSRENFVIKIDYQTGAIKWLLGNQLKPWYTDFPLSLRPLALTVIGDPPIGQHALSLVGDGNHLLLFNNGYGSELTAIPDPNDNRTYSKASLYEIDETQMTATEIWSFDAGRTLYSSICGSVYKTRSGDYLIDFATTEDRTVARIMIVDENKNLLFDMTVPKRQGDVHSGFTMYRVREMELESLVLN